MELLTPPQIARELKVSPDTVRGWIRDGLLQSAIIGKKTSKRTRRRVLRTDLDEFIQSRKDKTIEPRAKPAPRAKKYVPVCLK